MWQSDKTLSEIIERADEELASPDSTTRWQAAIALGEYCESDPEAIWPLVEKWGSSAEQDTRTAIATCILEHILEYHFEPFFARSAKLIRQGNARFADTFSGCWKFGQANEPKNAARFDRAERAARRLVDKAGLSNESQAINTTGSR